MVAPPKIIKVTSETRLPDVLDDAAQSPVVLERDGLLFVVTTNTSREVANGLAEEAVPAAIADSWSWAERATSPANDQTETGYPSVRREPGVLPPTPDRETVLSILDEVAGSWADLDTDAMIRDIYEARIRGSRDYQGS
ncbi:MAG: hypothetical protein QM692_03885 [Thermomicrobiales bacterium]